MKALTNLPKHVAIIMDGNGRWAKERSLPRSAGHLAGYDRLKELAPLIFERGVEVLTVFALSKDNYQKRDKKEVSFLFNLFRRGSKELTRKLSERGVRVRFIGDRYVLPSDIKELMDELEIASIGNKKGIFVIAINYDGRDEIVRAAQSIIRQNALLLDETHFSRWLDTSEFPDPDLIIRTSGERRSSGFLLWQAAYAEYYFCEKYWPDFMIEDFDKALADYAVRERRFGK